MDIDRHNRARITRVSGFLRTVSFVGMGLWVAASLVLLISTILDPDGPYTAYFLLGSLLPLFGAVVTFHFFRFFARLRAGHLFDAETVSYLQRAGRWWMAAWAFDLALTIFGRRNGMPQLGVTLSGLLAAATVLFISWLLHEAQALQQDNELTV